MNRIKQYIVTRDFYLHALAIAIPMILQNMITNFVSMLDNVMVGQIGTMQMSGVSIVNQFIFVFNITIFGSVSGASIFGCQFFGQRNAQGQKYTFRFRLLFASLIILTGFFIFQLFDTQLISLFLSEISIDTLFEGTPKKNVLLIFRFSDVT